MLAKLQTDTFAAVGVSGKSEPALNTITSVGFEPNLLVKIVHGGSEPTNA